MLFLLAGLQDIPKSFYKAARIDGPKAGHPKSSYKDYCVLLFNLDGKELRAREHVLNILK